MPPDPKKLRRAQIRDAFVYWVSIPGAVLLGGIVLDRLLHLSPFRKEWTITGMALLLILSGVWLITVAMKDLARYGEGTPNPLAPPRKLVTQGSYRLCRHPLFFGYDAAALGIVLLLHSPGTLCIAYPLFLLLQVRFLKKEEAHLARRFPQEFPAYKERVPFLFPFSLPWRGKG
ncbi:MAG: isoprenylcysteine carboxylmethyltransferase family protein [Thermodesulfovibrionales bacterium]